MEDRSILGPNVMVGKVEYCNPIARHGSQPSTSRSNTQLAHWALVFVEESSCTQGLGSFYVNLWLWLYHGGGDGQQPVPLASGLGHPIRFSTEKRKPL